MIIKLNDEQIAYVKQWWPHFGTTIVAKDLGLDSVSVKRYVDANKLHILDKPLRLCTVCRVNYQRVATTSLHRQPAKCLDCIANRRRLLRIDNEYLVRSTMSLESFFRASANTLNYRNRTRHNSDANITYLELIDLYEQQQRFMFL